MLGLLRSSNAISQLPSNWRNDFFELSFRKSPIGWIHKKLSSDLSPRYFSFPTPSKVTLNDELTQEDILRLNEELFEKGHFSGWRNEYYPARTLTPEQEEVFYVERASASLFGLVRHSIHVNGYVRDEDQLKCWMGKRSLSKSAFPGLWDNMVAGGMPRGISPFECAIKECWEEASIPVEVSKEKLKFVGSLTRIGLTPKSQYVSLEEIFVFDLDMTGLPAPKPCDGEVEMFSLLTCEEVFQMEKRVKPDVQLVVADFMLRWGLLAEEVSKDPIGMLNLVRAMHPSFPSHL